ncbi:hypothetical protein ASZ78_012021 [Callipepla squamata]|uniref:DUF4472 domain-containing protein n=2 Tax=Callipepla squamata TaxID=9009 RepID=A0A226MIG2_CALSU|nr:hypothetical protein ASZ78_012021 [Callipepla squamata]
MDFGSVADKENVNALMEQVQHLDNKNVQLQDRNERLYAGFGDLQERMGGLTGSKPDLSPRTIFTEEEKLKISKELVDLQIDTNKMKEQYETEKFELKNMILALENRVLELELRSEKVSGERDALRDQLDTLESSRKELADEYIILKSNYLALGKELDQELLGNQVHIKEEIENLKQTYDSQQQKLEEKVIEMGKELQEAKRAVHDPQQKLAEQSAVLLASQSQLQEVEAENSRLQLRLKELSEEYRCRLTQYIRDVAEYMDTKPSTQTRPSKAPAEHADMKRFVDSMLKDIRASYKAREEQLAGAARSYKKRMKSLAKKHESLLIAYSVQREKIRSLGSSEMDSGPAELHFAITDPELLTHTTQELNRLRENKAKLEMQLHELQKKRLKETSGFQLSSEQKRDEEGWAEVRKQLQEFTHTTQEDLEKERSQLLTRAIVAEEQVLELQDYIEKHLARYRQEVLRIRKLAGGEEPRTRSAGAADAHTLPRSRRAISREL